MKLFTWPCVFQSHTGQKIVDHSQELDLVRLLLLATWQLNAEIHTAHIDPFSHQLHIAQFKIGLHLTTILLELRVNDFNSVCSIEAKQARHNDVPVLLAM